MFLLKWFKLVLCLAALATAGLGESFIAGIFGENYSCVLSLGIYGSGLSIKNVYENAATSFGCVAPV
jgi:hypothetical protein